MCARVPVEPGWRRQMSRKRRELRRARLAKNKQAAGGACGSVADGYALVQDYLLAPLDFCSLEPFPSSASRALSLSARPKPSRPGEILARGLCDIAAKPCRKRMCARVCARLRTPARPAAGAPRRPSGRQAGSVRACRPGPMQSGLFFARPLGDHHPRRTQPITGRIYF